MALPHSPEDDDTNIDVHTANDTPIKYVPLDHVYSATSPCITPSGSSTVMSKKVKARKLTITTVVHDGEGYDHLDDTLITKPPVLHVYSRRAKRNRACFYDQLGATRESEDGGDDDEEDGSKVGSLLLKKKRRILGIGELVKLGVDSSVLASLDRPRLRDCRSNVKKTSDSLKSKKTSTLEKFEKVLNDSLPGTKRWVR